MFAMQLLDEGVATALGSCLNEHVTGKTDFSYNDLYINNVAKAIYPLVQNYIKNGKSIDEFFVRDYIKICEKIFPQAIYEYKNCFKDFYMLVDVDGGKRRPLVNILRKYFNSKNFRYQFETPVRNDKYIQEMKSSNTSKFILISQNHKETYQYLVKNIPDLSEFNDLDTKSDFVLSFLQDDGYAYIIINIHDLNNFEYLIKIMFENKTIKDRQPLLLSY